MINQEIYIRKPAMRNGKWCVAIAASRSPLAKELEVVECTGREAAFQAYRRMKKEQGLMH